MSDEQHAGELGAVYRAKSPDEIAALYDGWASTYEADMAKAGYRHPAICTALLARHLTRGSAPLLDAGAGTGLLGEWLGILDYPVIEALDLSEGMLAIAEAKQVYSRLHRLALGGPLPFADASFAGIISAGVFTSGHVGAEGLPELLRICRPGGIVVLTIKVAIWDAGIAAAIASAVADGQITVAEQTAPYVSMPGESGTTPSLAIVLRRN